MNKLTMLLKKNSQIISYLFFGVLTTVCNIAFYAFFTRLCFLAILPSTILAWVISVLFAYITNKKWVFSGNDCGVKAVAREMLLFFSARIITGVLDWAIMYIFADMLSFNDLLIKVIANIIVIILNFIASKWIVFKKR